MDGFLSGMIDFLQFKYKNLSGIKHRRLPEYVVNKIRPDSIVIDCGANVGNVSAPLVRTGAELYCFEPHPGAFEILKERFINQPNVKVFNSAVGTYAHKAKLYKHQESSKDEIKYSTGASLIDTKENINIDDYYEIDVINFPEFINSFKKRISLVKVDIEGAEVELLNELINEGAYKKIDFLFVETHERKIPELEVPTKELKSRIRKLKIRNIYTNWT